VSFLDQIKLEMGRISDEVISVSEFIHDHPETAWREVTSASFLCDRLEGAGFDVVRSAWDLETAFEATIGDGDLHLELCAEYDALPGLGHACGHNFIAAAAFGAAAALAPVAADLGVTLKVIGTPAEEGKGGKIELLKRGAFAGLHGAMMVHPGPVDAIECVTSAVSHISIAFDGSAAHSAGFPELGINAGDAMVIAQTAIGLLRQHLPKDVLVHGIVTRGGEAPNAVPARTEGSWYVRSASLEGLTTSEPRVLKCFEAGALATGSSLTVEYDSDPYSEFRNSPVLLDAFRANFSAAPSADSPGMARSSTDMGNVSWAVPSVHPYIGIGSGDVVNHQAEFAQHAVSARAHRALLRACEALAGSVATVAADDAKRVALKLEAQSLAATQDQRELSSHATHLTQ
jgi:amidohydrolase